VIQSLQKQKQKQSKSITGTELDKLQSQSTKQIKSQISQLQKQVARIQNDIRRMRTAPKSKSKSKKLSASIAKPRSKNGKSFKATKVKKRWESR